MIHEVKEVKFDTETGTFTVTTSGLTLEDSIEVIKSITARKYHDDKEKEAQIKYLLSKAIDEAY